VGWSRAAARPRIGFHGIVNAMFESPNVDESLMTEKPVSGPVALLPSAVADAMLHPRNAEALRRLKLLAEKRA